MECCKKSATTTLENDLHRNVITVIVYSRSGMLGVCLCFGAFRVYFKRAIFTFSSFFSLFRIIISVYQESRQSGKIRHGVSDSTK